MYRIYEKAQRGIPLEDILVIDCHAHIGYYKSWNIPGSFEEEMIASMDRLGVDIACITSTAATTPNYIYGNDQVRRAVSKYPDRFIGYVTVNPHYPQDMKNEMDRCFADKGMMAIKLHPESHECQPDYKNYHFAYEAANERKCPVLIHVWGIGQAAIVDMLAGQYPGAKFIVGHSGGFDVKAMMKTIDVVNRHDNVFADLCISVTYEGNVEWFTREMGSKKVLYGTDMPAIGPCPNFGRIAMARISDEEKKDILGLNMKNLLGL